MPLLAPLGVDLGSSARYVRRHMEGIMCVGRTVLFVSLGICSVYSTLSSTRALVDGEGQPIRPASIRQGTRAVAGTAQWRALRSDAERANLRGMALPLDAWYSTAMHRWLRTHEPATLPRCHTVIRPHRATSTRYSRLHHVFWDMYIIRQPLFPPLIDAAHGSV